METLEKGFFPPANIAVTLLIRPPCLGYFLSDRRIREKNVTGQNMGGMETEDRQLNN